MNEILKTQKGRSSFWNARVPGLEFFGKKSWRINRNHDDLQNVSQLSSIAYLGDTLYLFMQGRLWEGALGRHCPRKLLKGGAKSQS